MNKEHAREKDKNRQAGWETVLSDARVALRDAKYHVRSLKRSIAAIEEKIAGKEPFPVKCGPTQI